MSQAAIPHPAHGLPFDELIEGLEEMRAQRFVLARTNPDGLRLYTYTDRCNYAGEWNRFTTAARGLVVDPRERRIVATPFPKFFNVGERGEAIPALPFETMEKLDGSLIILFHHGSRWLAATKGSFDSAQALWAQQRLDALDLGALDRRLTYLAEAVYPENRIVVRYDNPALVMLAAYDSNGSELSFDAVKATAEALDWPAAERHQFSSMAELIAHADLLPKSAEGFVVRFSNGLRLKVKGAAYRRIHALISGVTPLAIWELMQASQMAGVREELPEEFWSDFDAIRGNLEARLAAIKDKTREACAAVAHMSDKEIGLALGSFDEDIRPFIFNYRRKGEHAFGDLNRQKLFRLIRPDGNKLEGYTPSYAIARVLDEAG